MKFCEKCDNYYYISIPEENENKLVYYCRNCGFRDNCTENYCDLKTNNAHGKQMYNYTIHDYTKYDPTLPRIAGECINPECKTNQPGKKKLAEIVYMRYDDANLKYAYICVECNTSWKTN